jgi:hypothetical protein
MRWVAASAGLLSLGYLCVLALWRALGAAVPSWLGWFGETGSWPTLTVM